jgi:hypothetical protein
MEIPLDLPLLKEGYPLRKREVRGDFKIKVNSILRLYQIQNRLFINLLAV